MSEKLIETKKKIPLWQRVRPLFGTALLLCFLSFSITALMVLYLDHLPSKIRVGSIATQDIKSDQNYELVDVKGTKKLRSEAAKNVLPVYDYEVLLAANRVSKITESFKTARKFIKVFKDNEQKLTKEDETKIRQQFQLGLEVALTDSDYAKIRKDGFSEDLEKTLALLVEPLQKRLIVDDKAKINTQAKKGIALRTLRPQKDPEEVIFKNFDRMLGIKEAQSYYSGMSLEEIKKKLYLDFTDNSKLKLALNVLPQLIKTNISLNKAETELRRENARLAVKNVIRELKKGEIIIRRGDMYKETHIFFIDGIRKQRQQTNLIIKFFGLFMLVSLVIVLVYSFAKRNIGKFKLSQKDLYFLSLMLVGTMALLRMGNFVATSMQDSIPFSDITTFYYLIPVAAGAMMVRYILNSESALVFAIVTSVLSGFFLDNNLEISVFYLLSSIFAANAIGHVERRSSVFKSGFYVGLINVALVLSLNLIGKVSSANSVEIQELLLNSLFALIGGILTSITILAGSPFIEAIFNYTTNIKLLELANMNHPLLREMIVRAPGTYHHSQLVGILAESGARAIDANPLLARVGSYYHDIGKMKKPQYFIENQKGDNPHDRLSPHMSALIIDAHVKDGIEMAKEHKLPDVISDFIPEHQGTKLIGYFYNKAKKMSDPSVDKIEEKDFRYKGPRPQSRESGIVMLADTIEAAVRSMPEKTPQKIQASVEKLVNMHFADGQLNECDITLRDLHKIVEAFVKILIGIYHQRVEYPDQKLTSHLQMVKEANKNGPKNSSNKSTSNKDNIAPLFKGKNQ